MDRTLPFARPEPSPALAAFDHLVRCEASAEGPHGDLKLSVAPAELSPAQLLVSVSLAEDGKIVDILESPIGAWPAMGLTEPRGLQERIESSSAACQRALQKCVTKVAACSAEERRDALYDLFDDLADLVASWTPAKAESREWLEYDHLIVDCVEGGLPSLFQAATTPPSILASPQEYMLIDAYRVDELGTTRIIQAAGGWRDARLSPNIVIASEDSPIIDHAHTVVLWRHDPDAGYLAEDMFGEGRAQPNVHYTQDAEDAQALALSLRGVALQVTPQDLSTWVAKGAVSGSWDSPLRRPPIVTESDGYYALLALIRGGMGQPDKERGLRALVGLGCKPSATAPGHLRVDGRAAESPLEEAERVDAALAAFLRSI